MLWTNLHGDVLYERLSDEISADEIAYVLSCNPDDISVHTNDWEDIIVFIYHDEGGKTIHVIYDPNADPNRLVVRYTDWKGRSHLPMDLEELW